MTESDDVLVPWEEARHRCGDPNRTDFFRLVFDGKLEARKLGPRIMITGESLRALPEKLRLTSLPVRNDSVKRTSKPRRSR